MGIYMHQHRLPHKGRDAGIYIIIYYECEAFTVKQTPLRPADWRAAFLAGEGRVNVNRC